MNISDLIRKLENIRNQYGNIPVYRLYDGDEQDIEIEVSSTQETINENYDMVKMPHIIRVLLY